MFPSISSWKNLNKPSRLLLCPDLFSMAMANTIILLFQHARNCLCVIYSEVEGNSCPRWILHVLYFQPGVTHVINSISFIPELLVLYDRNVRKDPNSRLHFTGASGFRCWGLHVKLHESKKLEEKVGTQPQWFPGWVATLTWILNAFLYFKVLFKLSVNKSFPCP